MLSLPINTHLGWAFYFFRRFDDAIKQLHATLELDRDYILARYVLGQAYTQRGQYTEAIAELQVAASLSLRVCPRSCPRWATRAPWQGKLIKRDKF